MHQIKIRRYLPGDLDALIELFRKSVSNLAITDYSAEQILAWAPEQIDRAAFADKRSSKPTWVAELDGFTAGFSDLNDDGHIDMLYVHPDCASKGVARALLLHVEASAREHGLARLHAEASITARPVFERLGFTALYEQTVTHGGLQFCNYRMEKILTASNLVRNPV